MQAAGLAALLLACTSADPEGEATQQPAPSPLAAATATSTPGTLPSAGDDLVTAAGRCLWAVAHGAEFPELPDGWTEDVDRIGTALALEMSTPAGLRRMAKSSVVYFDTVDEYIKTLKTMSADVNIDDLLSSHRLYCGELWQGKEATTVPHENDVTSAVAECIWRLAHGDEQIVVPEYFRLRMSLQEAREKAQELSGSAMAAYWIDEDLRAWLATGDMTIEMMEMYHHMFCGKLWGGV